MNRLLAVLLAIAASISSSSGAITITGIADKTKYNDTVSFSVSADPGAASTTATLDGSPTSVGANVTVTSFGYHELRAESRTAGGTLVDSKFVRFIVRDNIHRLVTEDGIPPFTPYRTVNDAPSAFASGVLKVIAPAAWPVGLPIPIAAILRTATNEPLRLNGVVTFTGLPQARLQLRRGWGSLTVNAATTASSVSMGAEVNGLTDNANIQFLDSPVFTTVSGTIAANTSWPANSRIRVASTLTINAGVTLTIGAGTIVLIDTGVAATNGSAAEIVVNGSMLCNGVEGNPIVFAPNTSSERWGGIELPTATSNVTASHTIFTGSGEDETWFNTHSGYETHQPNQALFLIAGSSSGTAIGAQLHLTECYCFGVAGQMMNSRTNTWLDLQRTLMQRAVTCGEINGSKVTIDRCALIEFPGETDSFVDGDNDAIYLTNGDLAISNTVIGFTKDDGVDSGGNGGDNPYTAGTDVTPYASTNNWYEGTYHEGNSLSGTRNVTFTGCVFLNCGQGVESGYSASATGNGPNALIDGCLFAGNMVAVRRGDNYGSGYNYNSTVEAKNSLILYSYYHDVWSYDWHPTTATGWIYLDHTNLNSLGKPICNAYDNRVTIPDPVHHPANTLWNPGTDGPLLSPFMPVPGSAVGIAISSYSPTQRDPSQYPGAFTVRLSTFSSQPVSVGWTVEGKFDPFGEGSTQLASGSLTFDPGETIKTITAPVASPQNYGLIHVDLHDPVNAEVTGESWFFQTPPTPDPVLVSTASTGWRYRESRTEPPTTWKTLGFNDATDPEWLACTLPAGFGVAGVTFGTTVTSGPANDRTKTFYFRKKFTVSGPALVNTLTFRIRRDDAAVVWLNNDTNPTLLSADGAFTPPYSYDATTLAANNVPNSTNTGVYLTYTIPPTKLVSGQNILAIQVHQTSLTSGDLLLDCELTATYTPPFELHLTKSGESPVLWWLDPDSILEESPDLLQWEPIPGAASPLPFAPSAQSGFFRLRK